MVPSAFVLMLGMLLLSPPTGVGQQSQPAHQPGVMIDYPAPPADLAGLVAEADAVVEAEVDAKRSADVGGATSIPVSLYEIHVIDVLKPHSRLAATVIEIGRFGGDRLIDGQTVATPEIGFPDFDVRRTYVLFLRWNDRTARFDLVRGADSALEVTDSGRIDTRGRSTAARMQKGAERQAVVDAIRSAVQAKK